MATHALLLNHLYEGSVVDTADLARVSATSSSKRHSLANAGNQAASPGRRTLVGATGGRRLGERRYA